MKIKCRHCHKKFNVKNNTQIECERKDCRVKYNTAKDELDFEGFEESLLNEVTVVESFKSEKPVVQKMHHHIEMTEAEWAQWLRDQGMYSGDID